jgi:nucleotide-binding universal stress UspA family protein
MEAAQVHHRFRAVMFAYDGSPEARVAIAEAPDLLASRTAVVVHVYDAAPYVAGRPSTTVAAAGAGAGLAAAGLATDPPDEVIEANERAARECAEEGAELARRRGFDAQALATLARGTVADTLLELAHEWHTSPLVVGARHQGVLKSAVMGSVASDLVKAARHPVLIVPSPEAD